MKMHNAYVEYRLHSRPGGKSSRIISMQYWRAIVNRIDHYADKISMHHIRFILNAIFFIQHLVCYLYAYENHEQNNATASPSPDVRFLLMHGDSREISEKKKDFQIIFFLLNLHNVFSFFVLCVYAFPFFQCIFM